MTDLRIAARIAILTALSLILFLLEGLLPLPLPVPGAKLGLAAVVTLVALYMLPRTCDTFLVLLLRILLAAAFGGGIAPMLYSLAGGAASFAAMALLKARTSFSVVGISAVGGFLHNMGQLGVAAAVMQTDALLIYAPVLGIAGILTGLAVGLLTKQILQKISTG
ncbi:Gx transporter family protein [Selenomonas artemidis]|uniref:Gx transporter family protein n=1 Tax=Selenomonas artemidis TaxID=671224 RepID=UPI0028896062|nr:Gx transporter family protein [Selenomonas artemidis]